MEIGSLVQKFFRTDEIQNVKSLHLRTGQIVQGKILKLMNEQFVMISINGMKVIAKSEIPLREGQKSFFLVISEENGLPKLKLLNTYETNNHSLPITDLLKTLQLKDNVQNRNLLATLIEKRIPLSKDNVLTIEQYLLQTKSDITTVLHGVEILNDLNLPITFANIRATEEFFHGEDLLSKFTLLSQQLNEEIVLREQSNDNSEEVKLLKQVEKEIRDLLTSLFISKDNIEGKELQSSIKKYLRYLRPEANMETSFKQKLELLLGIREKLPDRIIATLETIVYSLHGQQLMIEQDSNLFTQTILQFPHFIPFSEQPVYVQIHSKKKGNRSIDLEDVRLVFLFQFPNLGDLIVQLDLFQKQMIVRLYNDHPSISEIVKTIAGKFEEFMKNQGYQISGIQVRTIKELKGRQQFPSSTTPYQGVDIRI
ncbi:hypothetical protein [Tepidibacillus fermentans]|uniref:Flagellar hook-length control protein FliK n=1 Tax=Tepidibacillus fermentans TaxID=1281767 RepID=A0A4R3K881_9BACI|nr:hypothetical protein [Tepidibacillus fermentans]TCS79206.1 hypothetical protein EDD72_12215 [Tepidibacillus fermentans]